MQNLERGLLRAANIVIRKCLAVKPNEKVVVVTDEPCRAAGVSIWTALRKKNDAVLIEIIPRKIHGEEPPHVVTEALGKCDVFIMPTSHSLTHTQARITANRAGARGATMPGITVEMMLRALNADYRRIERLTKKVGRMMNATKCARIESESGTKLVLDVSGRSACLDTGIVTGRGMFSNLPAGEAYIAPLEGRSRGRLVVDGSFAPIGAVAEPVVVEVKRGKITSLKGNRRMSTLFARYGKNERTLCEFGIGTNYKAKITGNVLEDEKVLGTIHVAFGNNLAFGGKNRARIHLDAVIRNPSVWLDDKLIIRKGKFSV